MNARTVGWALLATITLIVIAAAVMLLDRREPITDRHWWFVRWKDHNVALVQFSGNRQRQCAGSITRMILNGDERNTILFPFASYETQSAPALEYGPFTTDLREVRIPDTVDLTLPVRAKIEAEYACNWLQYLWPIKVEWEPLPLPVEGMP